MNFEKKLREILFQHGAVSVEKACDRELYRAISYLVREELGKRMFKTDELEDRKLEIVFISTEFLPGAQLRKNIDYLGIKEELLKTLQALNIDLEKIFEMDMETELGYSDLGHISDGVMDTLAASDYNAIGYGILYREGYFTQTIERFNQTEIEDNWWRVGKSWLFKGNSSYKVSTKGSINILFDQKGLTFEHINKEELNIDYYDLPYLDFGNGLCKRLRLFDHDSITRRIHPENGQPEEQRTRLKQEYILVSGAMQDIIRRHLEKGRSILSLSEHYIIAMFDSNNILAVPELMRLLLDEYRLEWQDAWNIVEKIFYYAPIESLERSKMVASSSEIREWLPRHWMIIEEIHHRYMDKLLAIGNIEETKKKEESLLWDNEIRLKNVAKASINSHIQDAFVPSINHRRWLVYGNPKLLKLLSKYLSNEVIDNPKLLQGLSSIEDEGFMKKLAAVKYENKLEIAQNIQAAYGIVLNPHALYYGYFNSISEKNRQLLVLLCIIEKYLRLKDNPNIDTIPVVYLLGGRADPKDYRARLIVELAARLSYKINSDFTIKDKLKLIFVDQLSIKRQERLYRALDVSIALTTPTKASLSLSSLPSLVGGSLLLAGKESFSLELGQYLGSSNAYNIGTSSEEAEAIFDKKSYSSTEIYYKGKVSKRTIDTLLGREVLFKEYSFRELYDLLIKYNDHDFVLKDLGEFIEATIDLEKKYLEQNKWLKAILKSIELAGSYSSDAVLEYYEEKLIDKLREEANYE